MKQNKWQKIHEGSAWKKILSDVLVSKTFGFYLVRDTVKNNDTNTLWNNDKTKTKDSKLTTDK